MTKNPLPDITPGRGFYFFLRYNPSLLPYSSG